MKYYTGKHVNLNSYRNRKKIAWKDVLQFCKKPAVMIIATVIICAGILGGTFKKAFSYKYVDLGGYTSSDLGITADLPEGVVNIALFGIDSRNSTGFSGNSDSIMILSINTETKTVKLTSIMRDSLVEISDWRTTKINAAYARGGATLAMRTINQNFNMNITEYATVNFSGMAEIIDAIGGITVNLSESELKWANVHLRALAATQGTTADVIKGAGEQKLSGTQAVAFARIRYSKFAETGNTDDFGRTDRQRYVMEQLLNTVLKMNASKYPNLIKTCLPYVETSLSYKDILSFASLLTSELKFEQTRIPDAKYVINAGFKLATGGSSVYYNLDFATDVLHAFIYEDIDTETYLSTHNINKTGWYNVSGSYVTNTSSKINTPSSSSNIFYTSSKDNTSSVEATSSVTDVSSEENTSSEGEVSSEVNSSEESNVSSDNVSDQEQSSSENTSTSVGNDGSGEGELPTVTPPAGGEDEGAGNEGNNENENTPSHNTTTSNTSPSAQ